ncbi:hypothetical protein MRB53_042134 [Persea americana]|nr:hypothetical protein MRB53_042134 [Persea americana]
MLLGTYVDRTRTRHRASRQTRMPDRSYGGPSLPSHLLQQLGAEVRPPKTQKYTFARGVPATRKDLRKEQRQQARRSQRQPNDRLSANDLSRPSAATQKNVSKTPKLDNVETGKKPSNKPSAEAGPLRRKVDSQDKVPKVSSALKRKLQDDDDEIAALEKKLGLKKNNKALPKGFDEDGLGELLEGLDEDMIGGSEDGKREHDDAEWLSSKRRRTREIDHSQLDDESEDSGSTVDLDEALDGEQSDSNGSDDDGLDDDDRWQSDSSGAYATTKSPQTARDQGAPRERENPYVAPSTGKYVPPSQRTILAGNDESAARLTRQTQGLLNRLSEANLLSIVGDVEKLYQSNARQEVTDALVRLLLGLLGDRTALLDTFVVLHAGFAAAVHKVIGTDFSAQLLERTVALFDTHHDRLTQEQDASKEASNLVSFLAQLYNFQLIGSTLIYDYLRIFLQTLSEVHTELLLRIIKCKWTHDRRLHHANFAASGTQLRQDDPSSLKDIVTILHRVLANTSPAEISVRTQFMVESINDLKNNKTKASSGAASAITTEHVVRMRKMLGSLKTRTLRGVEPLNISLNDIRDTDKRGKWWLVGASWKGAAKAPDQAVEVATKQNQVALKNETLALDPTDPNFLLQLAKQRGMNTPVRRAIFLAVVGAVDITDARTRLTKLNMTKSQQLEIPSVLVTCAGAETPYNNYYALLAKAVCADHRMRKAFQFALWNVYKELGPGGELEDDDEGTHDFELTAVVYHAKTFAVLLADGALDLSILKNLDMIDMKRRMNLFMEVLLVTMFLRFANTKRKGPGFEQCFRVAHGHDGLAAGLQYFLDAKVSKTELVANKMERTRVTQGCLDASRVLQKSAEFESAFSAEED